MQRQAGLVELRAVEQAEQARQVAGGQETVSQAMTTEGAVVELGRGEQRLVGGEAGLVLVHADHQGVAPQALAVDRAGGDEPAFEKLRGAEQVRGTGTLTGSPHGAQAERDRVVRLGQIRTRGEEEEGAGGAEAEASRVDAQSLEDPPGPFGVR